MLSISKREKIILLVLVGLMVVGGLFRLGSFLPANELEIGAEEKNLDWEGDSSEKKATTEEIEDIYVDVVGAVKNPGVLSLPEGARVYEAIEKAEVQEDALIEEVNQARPLVDGEKIVVPFREEGDEGSVKEDLAGDGNLPLKTNSENDKININHANAEDFMELSGIGEVRAQDIVDYREEYGYFQEVEGIKEVPGIGDITFKNIQDQLTVY